MDRAFLPRIQYMDDIAVWSQTLDKHTQNLTTLLQSLLDNELYLNPKKTKLFCSKIRFLGHRISAKGVEADESKTERVTNWPTPTCMKHVRAFLGLICYPSAFLPKLAQHTAVLDELTTKECNKTFPPWEKRHQTAFDTIVKAPPMVGPTWTRVRVVLGSDCLPALFQGTILLLPPCFLCCLCAHVR